MNKNSSRLRLALTRSRHGGDQSVELGPPSDINTTIEINDIKEKTP